MSEQPNYYSIIPANVRYDNDLSSSEKLFYGEITALSNIKGYCWASNDYFSRLYGVIPGTISRWVSKLADKGYITVEYKYHEGTRNIDKRIIIINDLPIGKNDKGGISKNAKPPISKNAKPPISKNAKENNTSSINNTSINIYSRVNSTDSVLGEEQETNKQPKKESDKEFERLWELYPNKKGKQTAKRAYLKAVKDNISPREIEEGILAYKKEIKLKGTPNQYIAHGSTWFNQRRWEDEYNYKGKVISETYVEDAPTNPDEVQYSDEDRYWYEKLKKEQAYAENE